MMKKDVIIIGSGPAGLSAALYLIRAGYDIGVVSKGRGALDKAEKIENYFGFEQPISGARLLDIGENQIKALGSQIICDEITSIAFQGSFALAGVENNYTSSAVIIATGVNRKKLNIKNVERFEGTGVSYCAVCDAFFFKNKTVGVLGAGEYALHEAETLLKTSGKVIIFTNGEETTVAFPKDTEIINEKISELAGKDRLEKIVLQNGQKIDIDGLFIALGTAGAADFARTLGVIINNTNIVTNNDMETNLPGVFACGDCIGGVLQVSTAVGEGCKAALSAIKYLKPKE